MRYDVIYLQTDAPAKPAPGQPCNGCGVCCAWQPCPLGVLASRRRHGSCVALRWAADAGQYRCGLLTAPETVWPWLPAIARPLLQRLARRWIAAGIGCDCEADTRVADADTNTDTDAATPRPPRA
jgi:hypothetical protein